MSDGEDTHYAVLGVAEDAPTEEIRKAAQRLLRKNHPDVGGDPETAARINQALNVLGDADRRAKYDEERNRLADTPQEDAVPDPDEFEDSWGTEDTWQAGLDEEELDVDVEEDDPVAPPRPTDNPPPPEPAADDVQEDPPPTRVRTVLRAVLLYALAPLLILLAAVFLEAHILLAPSSQLRPAEASSTSSSPWMWPSIGGIIALLGLLVFARRLPRYPGRFLSRTAPIPAAFAVVSLGILSPSQPFLISAAQAFFVVAFCGYFMLSGLIEHHNVQRILPARSLKSDGSLFGPSTGDAAGELLNATLYSCMTDPRLHSARAFQTDDADNPFTKALLLGNRVVFLRPLLIPATALPPGPSLYWSQPSLFIRSALGDHMPPLPVCRMDSLPQYRRYLHRLARNVKPTELLVVYTDTGGPIIVPPDDKKGMPSVAMGGEAVDIIKGFLLNERKPVNHVDQAAAVESILGLQYTTMME